MLLVDRVLRVPKESRETSDWASSSGAVLQRGVSEDPMVCLALRESRSGASCTKERLVHLVDGGLKAC